MTRRLAAIACGGLALGMLGLWLTRPAAPPFDAVRAAHGASDARLLDRHGAVLDTRRVARVFTFDRHFRQYGRFQVLGLK